VTITKEVATRDFTEVKVVWTIARAAL